MRCTHARVWQENSFYRKIALSKSMCMHMYMCVRACLFDMQSLTTKKFQTAPPHPRSNSQTSTPHITPVCFSSLSLSLSLVLPSPLLSLPLSTSLSLPPSLSPSLTTPACILPGRLPRSPGPGAATCTTHVALEHWIDWRHHILSFRHRVLSYCHLQDEY